MASSDRWSRWLLADRDAGDQAQRDVSERFLHTVANRVLAGAGALEGKTLLDIGTGDGLIGRAALPAVGSRGLVVFSDVSEPLLDSARARVAAAGFADRARFVVAPAEALAPIADRSVETDPARGAVSLRALLDGSPNPLAPRIGEVIERALDAGEREQFVGRLGAAIEQGAFRQRRVAVYLVAHRPGEPLTSS